jgi:NAD+ kinase
MKRKRILILGNMNKPGVREQIRKLRPWFARRATVAAVLPAAPPLPKEASRADVCVVFGGDGTLLAAARLVASRAIPLLGVNMGKLGFLAEYNVEHMKKHFGDILRGKIKPVERMMLEVCVKSCRKHAFCSPVANDVTVSAGPPFRMVDLQVAEGQRLISRYLGDGVIVSTPTGSTGYNLSVGGPIMEPTLDAIVISPIAPHSLALRPIVLRGDATVRVTATRVNAGSAIIVDGQVSSGLCDGDVVEVRRARRGMFLLPHPGRMFFSTLAEKLQWGLSPHHG